mmetsp:Transcript_122277/g.222433  ORF Transcript_122277/g.222433 Transcript_122277/m.222433 type:complete len:84 (-) Transcript_122277:253-504(-)
MRNARAQDWNVPELHSNAFLVPSTCIQYQPFFLLICLLSQVCYPRLNISGVSTCQYSIYASHMTKSGHCFVLELTVESHSMIL